MFDKLYKHQQSIVDEFPQRRVLVWETGTGKSLAAMALARKVTMIEHAAKVLVICPKSLKSDWQFRIKDLPDFKKWHVVTKEEFKRDWAKLEEYVCVIVDECHYFHGMKSAMSKSLEKYFKKWNTPYRYMLTATPFRSSAWDIYRMCELLGHKMNYWSFLHKFFYYVMMGSRQVPLAREGMEEEIAKLVATVGNTVKLEDCADVPTQTFETEYFELTKDQNKAIENITEIMPIVRYTQIHQITGGSLKGDGYVEDRFFKSDKLDRLKDIVSDNDRTIVVCRYNNEIDMIMEHVLSEGKPVFMINGSISGEDRHEIIKQMNGLSKYVLLVNAACSEGWEAPGCPLMVFYSYSFSLKDYIQMKGRILRINALKKNTYLSLVTRETIDQDIFETITIKKHDFHLAIYTPPPSMTRRVSTA